MGKRKRAKKVGPAKKVALTVPKVFDCPFCNHEKTVKCQIDKKQQIGSVTCDACCSSYQTQITALDEPVDIYTAWLDKCHDAQQQAELGERAPELGDL
ncbi:putative transcription elongation factor 1 [Paratrimastix pyriformis]|uniref:Transcription elongation factor 1 homolog n=1 Tax=Paratrimastix pyriformis TaxID=342808 RepID=A0ABQ8UNZ5_9EUKA|nr:putative transcription elongation factor 1 [Paratrimastix pyriformis]